MKLRTHNGGNAQIFQVQKNSKTTRNLTVINIHQCFGRNVKKSTQSRKQTPYKIVDRSGRKLGVIVSSLAELKMKGVCRLLIFFSKTRREFIAQFYFYSSGKILHYVRESVFGLRRHRSGPRNIQYLNFGSILQPSPLIFRRCIGCIEVHEENRDMQRILQRQNSSNRTRHHRLKRVTYGTSSAPFLATRCLQKVAKDNFKQFPEVAEPIKSEFYVDDWLSGRYSFQQTLKRQRNVHQLLTIAHLPLIKYASNSKRLLSAIDNQLEYSKRLNLIHARTFQFWD